jgi:hypothetical protein
VGDASTYGSTRQYKNWFVMWNDRASEHPGCTHLYMQYLKARRDYFPDYPAPRLDAAITNLQSYYDLYQAKRNAGLAYKMAYLYPSHGALLPPSELGPN